MTTAQERYKALVTRFSKLVRIETGQMFGKPCLKINSKAFLAFHEEHLVFKLAEAVHSKALTEKGSFLWDPSGKGRPMKEWVSISCASDFDEDAYAQAAFQYVSQKTAKKNGGDQAH